MRPEIKPLAIVLMAPGHVAGVKIGAMCKLIVLDDDPIQHLIFKRMLSRYTELDDTIFCADGNRVIGFLSLNKGNVEALPEVIFMDLHMPELNGWKFLEKLKALYPDLVKPLKVYVISSSIDPRDIRRSRKYDFVGSYIMKPIGTEMLSLIIAPLITMVHH